MLVLSVCLFAFFVFSIFTNYPASQIYAYSINDIIKSQDFVVVLEDSAVAEQSQLGKEEQEQIFTNNFDTLKLEEYTFYLSTGCNQNVTGECQLWSYSNTGDLQVIIKNLRSENDQKLSINFLKSVGKNSVKNTINDLSLVFLDTDKPQLLLKVDTTQNKITFRQSL